MNGDLITKEEIRAAMEVLFHGCPGIQSYDPYLVQVSHNEIRDIIVETIVHKGNSEEAMLSCNRAVNAVIYRVMDQTRGSDYESYYMEAFDKPGVPPKYVPKEEALAG